MEVRCRHCCKSLFKGTSILFNAHNEVKQSPSDTGCEVESDCCSYVTPENAPDWIMNSINQESWIKGKLHCPHCNSRLGSFNFINELKCHCNRYLRPPIRIVNSKIDILCKE